jgi:uncharacterized protein
LPEIICNTSPLQYLHQLGAIELLHKLVNRMTVPAAVVEELSVGKALGLDLPDVALLDWVTVQRPQRRTTLPRADELGKGETEVLQLAIESPGAVVVLDDGIARQVAESLGIKLTGSLGVLRDAKRAGLIPAIATMLDRLQALGFRLAPRTRNAVLRQVGELA